MKASDRSIGLTFETQKGEIISTFIAKETLRAIVILAEVGYSSLCSIPLQR